MQSRVAVVAIVVEDPDSVGRLNGLLHEYAPYVVGRMGIPYRQRGISVISVAVDAPMDTISALVGKVGSIPGVSAKTAYSNAIFYD